MVNEEEVEFTAYEENANLMSELVDKDYYVEEFFSLANYLFGDSIGVRYIDGEYDNQRQLVSGGIDKILLNPGFIDEEILVIPTNIKLIDQKTNEESCHSVIIIKDNNKLYLFDPNGYYNNGARDLNDWLYCIGDKIFNNTTEFYNHFNKSLKKQGFEINTSRRSNGGHKGIQVIPKYIGNKKLVTFESQEGTRYIGMGGYCMFYNMYAIKYIIENIENFTIEDLFNNLTDPEKYYNVFPYNCSEKDANNGTAQDSELETIEKFSFYIINELQNIITEQELLGGFIKKSKRKKKIKKKSKKKLK